MANLFTLRWTVYLDGMRFCRNSMHFTSIDDVCSHIKELRKDYRGSVGTFSYVPTSVTLPNGVTIRPIDKYNGFSDSDIYILRQTYR